MSAYIIRYAKYRPKFFVKFHGKTYARYLQNEILRLLYWIEELYEKVHIIVMGFWYIVFFM
jgi:hypothetical protein